jgi:predicted dehydrogenase
MCFKVIIAGTGAAGYAHLKACKQINAVKVTALCDPDLDRAKNIAKQNNILHVFKSLDDALRTQPSDIVHVCTPPSSHYELCRLALKNGCHVLVEKPIFNSLNEAEQIQKTVRRSGCKFSAVHNGNYQRGMRQAKKIVKKEYIGELRQISAVRMLNGKNDRMVPEYRHWCHKLPGGRWEELIAHPIYKARQFVGHMRFVHLEMKRLHNFWPWLPADELEIFLESKKGYVNIRLSANADNYDFMFLYGSKRLLYVDQSLVIDPVSHFFPRDYKHLLNFFVNRLVSALGFRLKPLQRSSHEALIRDFISYIRGERPKAPVGWDEAFNTLELGLQIGKEIKRKKSL